MRLVISIRFIFLESNSKFWLQQLSDIDLSKQNVFALHISDSTSHFEYVWTKETRVKYNEKTEGSSLRHSRKFGHFQFEELEI